MYREAVLKRKKGMITRTEEEELRCQLKNVKEELGQKKKDMRARKREIQHKSGNKPIQRAAVKSTVGGNKDAAKYLARWKKNKAGYQQFSYEISAYRNYQEGLHKDVPGQYTRIRYAENEIRLLTIKRNQYAEGMEQSIRQKIRDFQKAKALWNVKDREIAVAKKKLKLIRLLGKKGQTVKSRVLEQKEQVAKLIYEKDVYRYQMEIRLIELDYGLENSVTE